MDTYCVNRHSFRMKQKEDEAKELSRMQSERRKRKCERYEERGP